MEVLTDKISQLEGMPRTSKFGYLVMKCPRDARQQKRELERDVSWIETDVFVVYGEVSEGLDRVT